MIASPSVLPSLGDDVKPELVTCDASFELWTVVCNDGDDMFAEDLPILKDCDTVPDAFVLQGWKKEWPPYNINLAISDRFLSKVMKKMFLWI